MNSCPCGAPWRGHDVCFDDERCEPGTRYNRPRQRAWSTVPGAIDMTTIELSPDEKARLCVGNARLPLYQPQPRLLFGDGLAIGLLGGVALALAVALVWWAVSP